MNGKTEKKKDAYSQKDVSFHDEELVKMIKEAEKGPFYTSSQVKEHLKEWKKSYLV